MKKIFIIIGLTYSSPAFAKVEHCYEIISTDQTLEIWSKSSKFICETEDPTKTYRYSVTLSEMEENDQKRTLVAHFRFSSKVTEKTMTRYSASYSFKDSFFANMFDSISFAHPHSLNGPVMGNVWIGTKQYAYRGVLNSLPELDI